MKRKRIITIPKDEKSMRIALSDGYISTKHILDITGLTYRKLHYWEQQGVFGISVAAGSGHNLMWDYKLTKVLLILKEISEEMGSLNNMGVPLLKRIVDNYEEGGLQFSENTRLEWTVQ